MKLLFSWVTPLVRRGVAAPLTYDDLLPLPHDTTPKASTGLLWKHWGQVSSSRTQSYSLHTKRVIVELQFLGILQ